MDDWTNYGNSLSGYKKELFFMPTANKTRLVEQLQKQGIFGYGDYYYFFRLMHNLEDFSDVIPYDLYKHYMEEKCL